MGKQKSSGDLNLKHKHPEMRLYMSRFKSFNKCSTTTPQDVHQLATAGLFFYEKPSIAKCFSCGLEVLFEHDERGKMFFEYEWPSPNTKCHFIEETKMAKKNAP